MRLPLRHAPAVPALLVLAVGLGGCAAPTLPLPPPTALVSEPDTAGMVTVTGRALDGAFVFCLDEEADRGVIARADSAGHYSLRIAATSGQTLQVWIQKDAQISPFIEQIVPGTPLPEGGMSPDAGPDGGI